MPKRINREYHKRDTAEVDKFVTSLRENATKGGTFDSASADDFVSTATHQSTGVTVPQGLQHVLDEAPEGQGSMVLKTILDSIGAYEQQHGEEAPADVVQHAIHAAYSTTNHARRKYSLDSATSLHQDNLALQPNRAIVAILSAMGDAIPFAHYLPADIGSNEAALAIISHNAGSSYGAYQQGDLMDGHLSGATYVTSARVHKSFPDAGTGGISGQLTAVQKTEDECDPAAPALKLLRGRSLVYVNGVLAGREVDATGTGNSSITGDITIAGTKHLIGGSINPDTGAYTLTSTPALPATVPVFVEGFIDYERDASNVPTIITDVKTYKLHAKPWRVNTFASIDARTQMANELGLDPYSESVIAIQAQFANERHYQVLAKARRLAAANQGTYDFDWPGRNGAMTRNQVWSDFGSVLSAVSQQMALDTMNHGITHIYVGKDLAAQFMAMPRDMFEPSGVAERPSIFRLGRYLGRYEIYYTPRGVQETGNSAQMLCIGRATDVTRNPFILGDAVSPTVTPLAVGADLKQGAGFYARNFTAVNPHEPSSRGAALITINKLH